MSYIAFDSKNMYRKANSNIKKIWGPNKAQIIPGPLQSVSSNVGLAS